MLNPRYNIDSPTGGIEECSSCRHSAHGKHRIPLKKTYSVSRKKTRMGSHKSPPKGIKINSKEDLKPKRETYSRKGTSRLRDMTKYPDRIQKYAQFIQKKIDEVPGMKRILKDRVGPVKQFLDNLNNPFAREETYLKLIQVFSDLIVVKIFNQNKGVQTEKLNGYGNSFEEHSKRIRALNEEITSTMRNSSSLFRRD